MVKEVPGVHAGTYGLAGAYMEKKEFAKAIPLYEQIVKAYPTDEAGQAAARSGEGWRQGWLRGFLSDLERFFCQQKMAISWG